MIAADQPTDFSDEVIVNVSSKADGSMLDRTHDFHEANIVKHRQAFCEAVGIAYKSCVYQRINYGPTEPYDTIVEVTSAHTTRHMPEVAADGLWTTEPGIGLFLPVADCVATVVYDPKKRSLGLFHLGRHGTYANLAKKAALYFKKQGSRPQDLQVWMSPSAGPESYALSWFDHQDDPAWQGFCTQHGDQFLIDLKGFNRARLCEAGVPPENIRLSMVNTLTNPQYFSHLAGDITGRFAVVAALR